jgi:hypothetical protein
MSDENEEKLIRQISDDFIQNLHRERAVHHAIEDNFDDIVFRRKYFSSSPDSLKIIETMTKEELLKSLEDRAIANSLAYVLSKYLHHESA